MAFSNTPNYGMNWSFSRVTQIYTPSKDLNGAVEMFQSSPMEKCYSQVIKKNLTEVDKDIFPG